MKAFWIYTAARIGLFLASYAVVAGIWLALNGGDSLPILWPLLIGALLSAALSAYLLKGPRERFAAHVQARAERMSSKFEELRAKEDQD